MTTRDLLWIPHHLIGLAQRPVPRVRRRRRAGRRREQSGRRRLRRRRLGVGRVGGKQCGGDLRPRVVSACCVQVEWLLVGGLLTGSLTSGEPPRRPGLIVN